MIELPAEVRMSYGELGRVLFALGFTKQASGDAWVFRHAATDSLLLFHRDDFQEAGPVVPVDLFKVRKTVVERGVASADEFEAVLRTHTDGAAGPTREAPPPSIRGKGG